MVTCINQKGGVSKSTTSEALADGLTLKGYHTLLIDLDAQGSVSLTAGAVLNGSTIYEVLTKRCTAQEAIQQRTHYNAHEVEQNDTHEDAQVYAHEVEQEFKRNYSHTATRADIIPASQQLAKIDIELTGIGKEHRLREQLKPLLTQYAYIVIDTPPALGLLTVNALTVANYVIIPSQADVYSMQGIHQLAETVEAVREYTNPELKLAGILLTRHNARSILSRDMTDTAKETADKIETFLYKTVIREGVAVKEAQANCLSIFEYAPKSNPAADYAAFVEEFLKRGIQNV